MFMIMQIQTLTVLLCIWQVFGISTCERLDFYSYIRQVKWFEEGIKLELYCTQDTTNDINIELKNQGIIVRGSQLVDGESDEYEFQKNSTVSVLLIKALSRTDDGIYFCSEAGQNKEKQIAQVKVLYSPPDKSPQCVSNFDSPVILDDLRQDYINFTCISDEGNPPVSVKADIFLSKTTSTNIKDICSENEKVGKGTSFSCHMDESLNNAMFHCDVTQQFPNPYSGGYSGSCSFGPLHFVSSFSITINEAYVTVKQGQNFNLKCTTNVPEVDIKWIGIPEDWRHTVTRDDYFSFVWIENVNQQLMSEINVHCIGSYGNKTVTDSVKIKISNPQKGKSVHATLRKLGISISVTLTFILTVIVSCMCSPSIRGKLCSLRHNSTSGRQHTQNIEFNTIEEISITIESNKSNENSTAIEGNERNSDTSGDQLQDTVCV